MRKQSKPNNQLRIIGGRWRGRKLFFPSIEQLRPTPDRVRETLFNWLQIPIPRSRVLDLFSGSGALGLEALSRGASWVMFVDSNAQASNSIQQHLAVLKCDQAQVTQGDVFVTLASAPPQTFDIVFLDPPFGKNLVPATVQLLENNQWLSDRAWVYIETETAARQIPVPDNWTLYRSKQAGQVVYQLFQRAPIDS